MKRILFGGSFDPIHNGHINIALKALKQVNADVLTFIPNKETKYKQIETDPHKRFDMVSLAIQNNPQFEISDMELKRTGVSYTIDTLKQMHQTYPEDELYFLMGSDQYLQFNTWKDYSDILKLCTLIVYPRNDEPINPSNNVIILEGDIFDISSSEIKNSNQWDKVPTLVNDFINDHGLYYMERYKMFNISEKRLLHSLRVAKMAYNIMLKNDPSIAHLAWTAGVYHDVCKCESQAWLEEHAYNKYHLKPAVSWKVLHGPVAARYLKEVLNFKNQMILDAIDRHTCPLDQAKEQELTLLDKVLYCADKLEWERTDEDLMDIKSYRELFEQDVDQCFKAIIKALSKEYQ